MSIVTIRDNRIFQRAYKKGKNLVSPILVTYVLKGKKNTSTRIGITTSKKIGTAVRRNQARRYIKESYRLLEKDINPGYDIIFVARLKTTFSSQIMVEKAMKKHLQDLGILILKDEESK